MKLIIGLGNPGKNYEKTKHNVGFLFIDYLLNERGIKLKKEKFNGYFVKDGQLIFAKPQTYMNLSGDFVYAISQYFNVEPADILIIYDDLAFDFGNVIFKLQGSSNGHNGIKSIINTLKTPTFPRIRVGIGPQNKLIDKSDFVLGKFNSTELKLLHEKLFPKLLKAIDFFIDDQNDMLITLLNSKGA